MSMTKKDFELVARLIAALDVSHTLRAGIAISFADVLSTQYERFDKERFINKCVTMQVSNK